MAMLMLQGLSLSLSHGFNILKKICSLLAFIRKQSFDAKSYSKPITQDCQE